MISQVNVWLLHGLRHENGVFRAAIIMENKVRESKRETQDLHDSKICLRLRESGYCYYRYIIELQNIIIYINHIQYKEMEK